MVAPPPPGVNLQKTYKKGTEPILHRLCEIGHKRNWLHKPPGLVEYSFQKEEGKNEKDLYVHNNIVGTDCLYVTSGPDI
jgi:hypothetical protein